MDTTGLWDAIDPVENTDDEVQSPVKPNEMFIGKGFVLSLLACLR